MERSVLLVLALTVTVCAQQNAPTWDVKKEPWSEEKVSRVVVKPDKHWAWHYIPEPSFTEPVEKFETTLNRGIVKGEGGGTIILALIH